MKRRGLFGLVGAGVAAPALASVTPARVPNLDEQIAHAELKIADWVKWRFGELVEVALYKSYRSEYGIAHQTFGKIWRVDDGAAPNKLANTLIEWIDNEYRSGPKHNHKFQTMVWRREPEFKTYDNGKDEPVLLKLTARGHIFAPGPDSEMSRQWSEGSRIWAERHPGKITLDKSPRFA